MNLSKVSLFTFGLIAIITASCDVTESEHDEQEETPESYTVALTAQGSENESTDYILNTNSLMEGALSAEGTGIEQTGWRYMASQNKTLFSIGYFDDNNTIAYELNSAGEIREKGRFVFENTLDLVGSAGDETMLAMEVPRVDFADRILHVIDVNSVSIQEKINMRIWESREDSLVAWPTALKVRDDKLFIPFYKLHARGDFTTPQTDSAYVAVYSWPELELEKYVTDTRMGAIGIYGSFNGMISDETGNLYGYSPASYANGFTTQSKSSGILRINSGETEFDDSYFFDIEQTAGGKINFFEYVGEQQGDCQHCHG